MNGQDVAREMVVAVPESPPVRLAALFDVHYDRLYRLARRLAGNAEDARDLVQDTFLRAARSPGSIPVGHAEEESWLVRVLIKYQRDQWRRKVVRERYQEASAQPRPGTRGREAEAGLIARTAVRQALSALPPRRRAVVILHELEGRAAPAIASLLGISAITVRWHLARGRRDLSRLLRGYLGENDD